MDELNPVEGGERTLFAAWTSGEIVAETESHEPYLEVTEIEVSDCREGVERLESGGQLEVAGRSSGAIIEHHVGTRPHASQLAEKRSHCHRSPAGQSVKGTLQLAGIDELLSERGQPPVVSIGDRFGECQKSGCRALVVADIAAFVEKRDELLPVSASCIRNRSDPRVFEHAVGAQDNGRRDPVAEQRRGKCPTLDLVPAAVDVDVELEREATAEGRDEVPRAADVASVRLSLVSKPETSRCDSVHRHSLGRLTVSSGGARERA